MSTIDDAKQKVKEVAHDAKVTATRKAEAETAHLRDQAVSEADRVSDAARAAGSQFPEDSLVSQALSQVGSTVDGLTAEFRNKPAGEMLDDLAVFARRNPLIFLGGAALVGFAAARFLKATPTPEHYAAGPQGDPWAGHLPSSGLAAPEVHR